MKIGITGASGHIGTSICRALITQGHEVSALVHHDRAPIQGLPVFAVKGNVLEIASLKRLMTGCEVVIHTAASIELSYHFNQKVYDINVTGTKNVLEVAKQENINKVVHFSSIHAFKQKPYETPVDETRSFVSDDAIFYDQTKRDAHLLAIEAAKNGQDVVIVCPTSVVGPPDYKPSKIGKAIIDIYKGSVPAVVKGGFDFADVRDVANGAIAAIHKGRSGETYLLGGKYYTIKQFADQILEIKGSKKRLAELPLFIADMGLPFVKWYASITKKRPLYDKLYIDILQDGNKEILSEKAKAELGYSVRDLKETLTDTIAWFKQNKMI